MDTIQEAIAFLETHRDTGVDCPCCGQYVKLYKRKLNAGMARFLIGLYRLGKKNIGDMYFSPSAVLEEMEIPNTQALDYSILKHFSFIKENDDKRENKSKAGFWMLTSSGEQFVLQNILTAMYVHVYDNRLFSTSGDSIRIKEALGGKFIYDELMSGV